MDVGGFETTTVITWVLFYPEYVLSVNAWYSVCVVQAQFHVAGRGMLGKVVALHDPLHGTSGERGTLTHAQILKYPLCQVHVPIRHFAF